MEIDITCLEASEYISALIDGELDDTLSAQLDVHLQKCSQCRFEHLLDAGTKDAVRRNLKTVPVPGRLRERITNAIADESRTSRPSSLKFPGFLSLTDWRMPAAFAGAVAIALVAVLFLNRNIPEIPVRPSEVNIVTETFNSFDAVSEGLIEPEIRTENHDEIMSYLKERANFDVRVPAMSGFTLIGGGVTASRQEPCAHVVYEQNGKYVLVRQLNFKSLLRGKGSYIPPDALTELQQSGWYFDGGDSDCTLAMWLEDSTLCMAVGDMRRDLLIAGLRGTPR